MIFADEAALREATRLLAEIDDNPSHPANDARHPAHQKCLKAYEALEHWCDEQRLLLVKQNRFDGDY